MKKFLLASIGLSLLLGPAYPRSASAYIYDLSRKITNYEFNPDGAVDDAVASFIGFQEVFRTEEYNPPISSSDVSNSLRFRPDLVCKSRTPSSVPCGITDPVRNIARRESFSRVLGRDLHLIAIASEMALTDHTGQDIMIAPRTPSIIRMWQSSFDWMYTPIIERRVRSHHLPPDDDDQWTEIMDGEEDLETGERSGGLLSLIGPEDFWRYRWGLNTVLREDPRLENCEEDWTPAWEDEIYDGSELIDLKKRNCALEKKMQEALAYLQGTLEYEPEHGEVIIFPLYKNTVWFRIWRGEEEEEVELKGDVGLNPVSPTNPFLPRYTCEWKDEDIIVPACVDGDDQDVVLGGMYPEPPLEPPEKEKLCGMVFSSKGYLCEPIESRECPTGDEDSEASDIKLTVCLPGGIGTGTIVSISEAGPDACKRGGWRIDEPTFKGEPVNDTDDRDDSIHSPYACSNCAVDLYCDGNGKTVYKDGERVEQNCTEDFAITYPKEESGVIPICLPSDVSLNSYALLHELVHAQQLCNLPSDTNISKDRESCCAFEMPAYYVQCSAIAADGNFEETDISVEICTHILSNHSCQHHMEEESEEGACTGFTYTPEEWEDWNDEIIAKASRNVAGLPTKCEDVINKISKRNQDMINSLPLVCQPECEARYENTIGNNACYIAQCVEESLETQRILPGRMTEISPEQTFPWDAETKNDPMIGSIMAFPPLPYTRFPKYRPALLAKELDLALCQLNGLPLKNPPHDCNINILRELAIKPAFPVLLGNNLITQTSQQFSAAWGLQTMAPSIGSRVATRIYKEYFSRAGRTFKDVLHSANLLVGGIANIEFPGNMCPRYGEL